MSEMNNDFENKMRKLEKQLGADLAVELKKSSTERIRDLLVEVSKEIEDLDEEKRNNATLNTLKEQLKDLNGGFNDAKKAKKQKLQYALMILQERGDI